MRRMEWEEKEKEEEGGEGEQVKERAARMMLNLGFFEMQHKPLSNSDLIRQILLFPSFPLSLVSHHFVEGGGEGESL